MGDTKDFFKSIPRTLNPDAYVELSRRKMKEATAFFVSTALLAFFLMILLSIPSLSAVFNAFNDQSARFNLVQISANINMTEPVIIPAENPFIVIDTLSEDREFGDEKVLLTNKVLHYNLPPIKGVFNLDKPINFAEGRQRYLSLIWTLVVLMAPTILFLMFVVFIVKMLIEVVIFFILGLGYSKLSKLQIEPGQIFRISLYSSVIPFVLIAVGTPIFPTLFFIPTALHFVYFAIAVILNGQKGSP